MPELVIEQANLGLTALEEAKYPGSLTPSHVSVGIVDQNKSLLSALNRVFKKAKTKIEHALRVSLSKGTGRWITLPSGIDFLRVVPKYSTNLAQKVARQKTTPFRLNKRLVDKIDIYLCRFSSGTRPVNSSATGADYIVAASLINFTRHDKGASAGEMLLNVTCHPVIVAGKIPPPTSDFHDLLSLYSIGCRKLLKALKEVVGWTPDEAVPGAIKRGDVLFHGMGTVELSADLSVEDASRYFLLLSHLFEAKQTEAVARMRGVNPHREVLGKALYVKGHGMEISRHGSAMLNGMMLTVLNEAEVPLGYVTFKSVPTLKGRKIRALRVSYSLRPQIFLRLIGKKSGTLTLGQVLCLLADGERLKESRPDDINFHAHKQAIARIRAYILTKRLRLGDVVLSNFSDIKLRLIRARADDHIGMLLDAWSKVPFGKRPSIPTLQKQMPRHEQMTYRHARAAQNKLIEKFGIDTSLAHCIYQEQAFAMRRVCMSNQEYANALNGELTPRKIKDIDKRLQDFSKRLAKLYDSMVTIPSD